MSRPFAKNSAKSAFAQFKESSYASDYTSIKDDFGSVQKLNTNEILKGFYQIRQQEYKELKDLSTKYVLNASSPVQVAGDDTIPGSYDSEKGALYNIRTIYNAG